MEKPLVNVPVSEILKNQSSFEEEPKKKSREDWRKAKELEEARKAGTAPAAVDEEGKDINPHIPQYISVTPWYFGAKGPTLKHQRPQPERQKAFSGIDEWYKRGVQITPSAKCWRKGACENCGAITHKRKDCMERPRKVGAKYTNLQIAPDEFLQPELSLDYDGKRDRWAGYDASEHRTIVEEFQKIEEAKKQMRAEKLQAEQDDEQNSDQDEDKYVDEVDMPGTKVDSKQRITVRNLRIREDTAKYLRNLDPNSAYYDPKTRSMRDNPHATSESEVDYKGENFVRLSGDTVNHRKAELFAWEAYEKGVDVHLLAEPTKLEMLKQSYDENKDDLKDKVKDDVIRKYGGEEHLKVSPSMQMLGQTEEYIEYSRSGMIIKCPEKRIVRSRYDEDNYPNNHTSIWGSYWYDGNWGYSCCQCFIKNSYCTGDAGKDATQEAMVHSVKQSAKNTEIKTKNVDKKEKKKKKINPSSSSSSSSSTSSSSSSDEDDEKCSKLKKKKKLKKKVIKKIQTQNKDKLKIALINEEEHRKTIDKLMKLDELKRPYNSMCVIKEPTEEEVEAYQIKRLRDEDPMAHFIGK